MQKVILSLFLGFGLGIAFYQISINNNWISIFKADVALVHGYRLNSGHGINYSLGSYEELNDRLADNEISRGYQIYIAPNQLRITVLFVNDNTVKPISEKERSHWIVQIQDYLGNTTSSAKYRYFKLEEYQRVDSVKELNSRY